mmetsp:Transcript_123132/g.245123  ORF Transcript_123132/g.245123 Transcript_123132/m.245123 type:complete len:930 (-) Transcript_123132:190-2979(-)
MPGEDEELWMTTNASSEEPFMTTPTASPRVGHARHAATTALWLIALLAVVLWAVVVPTKKRPIETTKHATIQEFNVNIFQAAPTPPPSADWGGVAGAIAGVAKIAGGAKKIMGGACNSFDSTCKSVVLGLGGDVASVTSKALLAVAPIFPVCGMAGAAFSGLGLLGNIGKQSFAEQKITNKVLNNKLADMKKQQKQLNASNHANHKDLKNKIADVEKQLQANHKKLETKLVEGFAGMDKQFKALRKDLTDNLVGLDERLTNMTSLMMHNNDGLSNLIIRTSNGIEDLISTLTEHVLDAIRESSVEQVKAIYHTLAYRQKTLMRTLQSKISPSKEDICPGAVKSLNDGHLHPSNLRQDVKVFIKQRRPWSESVEIATLYMVARNTLFMFRGLCDNLDDAIQYEKKLTHVRMPQWKSDSSEYAKILWSCPARSISQNAPWNSIPHGCWTVESFHDIKGKLANSGSLKDITPLAKHIDLRGKTVTGSFSDVPGAAVYVDLRKTQIKGAAWDLPDTVRYVGYPGEHNVLLELYNQILVMGKGGKQIQIWDSNNQLPHWKVSATLDGDYRRPFFVMGSKGSFATLGDRQDDKASKLWKFDPVTKSGRSYGKLQSHFLHNAMLPESFYHGKLLAVSRHHELLWTHCGTLQLWRLKPSGCVCEYELKTTLMTGDPKKCHLHDWYISGDFGPAGAKQIVVGAWSGKVLVWMSATHGKYTQRILEHHHKTGERKVTIVKWGTKFSSNYHIVAVSGSKINVWRPYGWDDQPGEAPAAATVNCGHHRASSCDECPTGNDHVGCNGDCAWEHDGEHDGECVAAGWVLDATLSKDTAVTSIDFSYYIVTCHANGQAVTWMRKKGKGWKAWWHFDAPGGDQVRFGPGDRLLFFKENQTTFTIWSDPTGEWRVWATVSPGEYLHVEWIGRDLGHYWGERYGKRE